MQRMLNQLDVVWAFNVFEAFWWLLGAVLMAYFGMRIKGMSSALRWWFVLILVAGSVTEMVECYTGAWWKPPLLAVAKGMCLVGAALGAALVWRARTRQG